MYPSSRRPRPARSARMHDASHNPAVMPRHVPHAQVRRRVLRRALLEAALRLRARSGHPSARACGSRWRRHMGGARRRARPRPAGRSGRRALRREGRARARRRRDTSGGRGEVRDRGAGEDVVVVRVEDVGVEDARVAVAVAAGEFDGVGGRAGATAADADLRARGVEFGAALGHGKVEGDDLCERKRQRPGTISCTR